MEEEKKKAQPGESLTVTIGDGEVICCLYEGCSMISVDNWISREVVRLNFKK